jgi:hypothetical protein
MRDTEIIRENVKALKVRSNCQGEQLRIIQSSNAPGVYWTTLSVIVGTAEISQSFVSMEKHYDVDEIKKAWLNREA